MKVLKKMLLGLGILILIFFLFSWWYKVTYSMDLVSDYEIKPEIIETSILIASQGSEYKDSLVSEVVSYLKTKPSYIKVTDVTRLNNVEPSEWDAVIIIHTWENWKPPEEVASFIDENYDANKMFIVTTSGDGMFKMENVDALTGASVIEEVPQHSEQIMAFLHETLNRSLTN